MHLTSERRTCAEGRTLDERIALCVAADASNGCRDFSQGGTWCPVQKWRERLERASVPARVRELLEGDRLRGQPLWVTPALQELRGLTVNKVLVALLGPVGIGKTVATGWALAQAPTGLYLLAPELWRPNPHTLAPRPKDPRHGLCWDDADGDGGRDRDKTPAMKVDVLVVDQLGREYQGASDYGLSVFEETVVSRFEAKRLTLLVGNITQTQLFERYGDIIADRIDGADGQVINLSGRSLRREVTP